MAKARAKAPKVMTHEERVKLINRPFPPVGGLPGQRVHAYPWAGTIVNDNWFVGFGADAVRERDAERRNIDADVDDYIDTEL